MLSALRVYTISNLSLRNPTVAPQPPLMRRTDGFAFLERNSGFFRRREPLTLRAERVSFLQVIPFLSIPTSGNLRHYLRAHSRRPPRREHVPREVFLTP